MTKDSLDDVWMICEFLKKEDFPECSLSISWISKSVENLLQRHYAACFALIRLPDDTIRTLP